MTASSRSSSSNLTTAKLKRFNTDYDTLRHGRELKHTTGKVRQQAPAGRYAQQIAARKQQVDALREGERMPAVTKPWPQPSTETLNEWSVRHPAFRTTTEGYQSTQLRMLWLLEVPHEDRLARFEHECWDRRLKPTTAESYWTSWLSACKAIGEDVLHSDKAHQKLLKKRAEAHPRDYPKAATLAQVQAMCDLRKADRGSYTTIIGLAFKLGQRVSDMIQLGTNCITIQNQHRDGPRRGRPRLAIAVKIGKVIGSIGPFTLWLNLEDPVARALLKLKKRATDMGRAYLLTFNNSKDQRTHAAKIVRDIITSVDPDLETRSIRRGGLQLMSNSGVRTKRILKLSKHTDAKMLLRYLDNGRAAAADAAEMIESTKNATLRM